jgi:hypothetical protein
MKTAAKIFSILSIIGGAVIVLNGLLVLFGADSMASLVQIPGGTDSPVVPWAIKLAGCIYLFIGIVVIAVEAWLTSKLNKATSKSELIVPGVIALILGGFLAGLFTLLIPEDEF